MFLDFNPSLPICFAAGSPYRQALSFTHHPLSPSADTTDSQVKMTSVSRSSSVNVKDISTKVPVLKSTICAYERNN